MKERVLAKKRGEVRCSRKSTLTSSNKISHKQSHISVRELEELNEPLVCGVVFLKHINHYGSEM
jgi:hypothetical protein